MVFVLTHYLTLIETCTSNSVIFVLLMLQRPSLSNTAAQIIMGGLIQAGYLEFFFDTNSIFFKLFFSSDWRVIFNYSFKMRPYNKEVVKHY